MCTCIWWLESRHGATFLQSTTFLQFHQFCPDPCPDPLKITVSKLVHYMPFMLSTSLERYRRKNSENSLSLRAEKRSPLQCSRVELLRSAGAVERQVPRAGWCEGNAGQGAVCQHTRTTDSRQQSERQWFLARALSATLQSVLLMAACKATRDPVEGG
jgi:hypothetical protein